jgi:hypothetical protein
MLALLLAAAALACAAAPQGARAALPPIRHVFVIVLENESESTSFGPGAPSAYLAQTLPSMGVFVPNYYGVGHASLDNYIAMISGQAPNPQTEADCKAEYKDFNETSVGPYEQAIGTGCVYPAGVQTLAGQLEEAHFGWKGYMQSMPEACSHPALNGFDEEQGEGTVGLPNDTYATRHNPFMWFHSIIDEDANCKARVVNLSALPGDLASTSSTQNLSFITPDVCNDGHDGVCKNKAEAAGFAGINEFLSTWVPQIVGSPAFKQDGLLVVTFDEAAGGDSRSCCGEAAPGGGDVGAVLVSPFIKPGTESKAFYNHYSLLASIDSLFSLPAIGNAAEPGTTTFGSDIFNLAGTGTPTSSTTTGQTGPTTGPTGTPSAPSCPSGRSVTIKLPTGKHRLSHAKVTVNGKQVKILGGSHPHVTVSLLHRPGSVVTVSISGRQGSHAYHAVHRYKPCNTA